MRSTVKPQPRTAHRNTATHWVPTAVPEHGHARTACGLDIDGPCMRHLESGEYCRYGLAWSRTPDQGAHDGYPPPCRACRELAEPLLG